MSNDLKYCQDNCAYNNGALDHTDDCPFSRSEECFQNLKSQIERLEKIEAQFSEHKERLRLSVNRNADYAVRIKTYKALVKNGDESIRMLKDIDLILLECFGRMILEDKLINSRKIRMVKGWMDEYINFKKQSKRDKLKEGLNE